MTTAKTYRKKPVTVQALQWTGDNATDIALFVGERDNGECRFLLPDEIAGVAEYPTVYDELHQTWVNVLPDNWIVRGIQGEFYPCDAAVFAATYDEVPG